MAGFEEEMERFKRVSKEIYDLLDDDYPHLAKEFQTAANDFEKNMIAAVTPINQMFLAIRVGAVSNAIANYQDKLLQEEGGSVLDSEITEMADSEGGRYDEEALVGDCVSYMNSVAEKSLKEKSGHCHSR